MKISELKLEQKVMIDGFCYKYKGIQKIRMSGIGFVQKIVFQSDFSNGPYFKYLNLHEGNKELKEENGKLILK